MDSIQKLHGQMKGVLLLSLDLERLKGPDFHLTEQVVSEIAEIIDSEVMDFADLEAMAISASPKNILPPGAKGWCNVETLLEPIATSPQKRLEAVCILRCAKQFGLSWEMIIDCIRRSRGETGTVVNFPDRHVDLGEEAV